MFAPAGAEIRIFRDGKVEIRSGIQDIGVGNRTFLVDLTAHAKEFAQITGPGAEIRGVRRVYAWLDEQRAAK